MAARAPNYEPPRPITKKMSEFFITFSAASLILLIYEKLGLAGSSSQPLKSLFFSK